jgi:CCR4-NOT transcriptional complex subunit CAF120
MAQQPPSDHDHPTSPRSSSSQISSSRREHLGRRPSGARAAPPRRVTSEARSESMPPVSAEDDEEDDELLPPARARPDLPVSASVADLGTADAIAAMSFLDNNASPPPPAVRALPPQPPPIQTDFDNDDSAPAPDAAPNFPSSFGPGKQAQERRAKLEAAQEQRQQVLTKPGRSKKGVSGGRATKKKASNWDASSEEDEDEEEEDDDASVDSNPVNNHQRVNSQPTSQPQSQASSRPSTIGGRPLPPQPGNQQQLHPSQNLDPRHSQYQNQQRQPSPQRQLSPNYPQQQQQQQSYPQQRQPSPNRQTSPYQQSHHQPEYSDLAPPRPSYANEDGGGRRTSSGYEFSAGGGSQGGHGGNRASSYTNWESDNQQIHQPAPRPAQTDRERARGSLWTTHLENPHGGQAEPAQENDKFVQLEPNERLTKAFNPNGLLGAGLEDRHDRSAKVQEQLARESGSSLRTSEISS